MIFGEVPVDEAEGAILAHTVRTGTLTVKKGVKLSAAEVKALIVSGSELALLDLREEGTFGDGHLLFAVPLPLSRQEFLVDDLVPRRDVPIVLCAGGDGDDELLGFRYRRRLRTGRHLCRSDDYPAQPRRGRQRRGHRLDRWRVDRAVSVRGHGNAID